MKSNKLIEALGIHYPIILAPMAGAASTPELVAAVSNAGGLGSFGAGYMSAEKIRDTIKQIRTLTSKPFAINLFIPEQHHATTEAIQQACALIRKCSPELALELNPLSPPFAPSFTDQMQVVYEEQVPVLSFAFGTLDSDWITKLKNNGTKTIGTATWIKEAIALEKTGVDFVVAQGKEAGGHRGTFIGREEDALIPRAALLHELVNALNIPVIAAGGIMEAKGIIDSFKNGAAAVQMGTAFLSCDESGIHPNYKDKVLQSDVEDITLTKAFSGKLAQGINNRFIERMDKHKEAILTYPIQNALTQIMRVRAAQHNNPEFMSMWAGQGVGLCQKINVSRLMQQLIVELNKHN